MIHCPRSRMLRRDTFSPMAKKWRRGELNPCPRCFPRRHLHVYSVLRFKEPNDAPTHCQLPSVREIDLTNRARSLRRFASLLSTFPAVAGVQPKTSRSIKPRERDLRDLRLFVLVRFLRGQRTILDVPPAL